MVQDHTLRRSHIVPDAPLMRRREAQSPVWGIRQSSYFRVKKSFYSYNIVQVILRTVHGMPHMHTQRCLHRHVDPWGKHLQTPLLHMPVFYHSTDWDIIQNPSFVKKCTCYNKRPTMDSVAEPAPALACNIYLNGKCTASKLKTKKAERLVYTSTTSVPPFWMRSVRYSISFWVNEQGGFTCSQHNDENIISASN